MRFKETFTMVAGFARQIWGKIRNPLVKSRTVSQKYVKSQSYTNEDKLWYKFNLNIGPRKTTNLKTFVNWFSGFLRSYNFFFYDVPNNILFQHPTKIRHLRKWKFFIRLIFISRSIVLTWIVNILWIEYRGFCSPKCLIIY